MPDRMCVIEFAPGVPSRAGGPLGDDLITALQRLPPGALPLAACCTLGQWVDDSDIAFSVLQLEERGAAVVARVGVFFRELVGGCNCHDDPTPSDVYCVLEIDIDRASGRARVRPVTD